MELHDDLKARLAAQIAAAVRARLGRSDPEILEAIESEVVLAVGEPIEVPRDASMDRMEDYRLQMQYATNALMKESEQLLGHKGGV